MEEYFDQIIKKLDLLLNKSGSIDSYESEFTNELNMALSKAQNEFPPISVNRESHTFRDMYADLDAIMEVIRPIISSHGLSLTQRTLLLDERTILQTRLWHSSGQWIESRTRVTPSKDDLNSYDSHMASIKRSQIVSLLGITVSDDPRDDDAEVDMMESTKVKNKGVSISSKVKSKGIETITKEQYEELEQELYKNNMDDITEDILSTYRIVSLADLPKNRYKPVIDKVRRIKNLRLGLEHN